MGAHSKMRVPTKNGSIKIPADSDSVPHIKAFLEATGLPFNDRAEYHRFCALTSSEQRESFIKDWKPRSNPGVTESQPEQSMQLATAGA